MLAEEVVTQAKEDDVCCALFDPTRWEGVRHDWKDKLFLKDSVPEVFHIPMPGTYRKAVNRMWKIAEEAGAAPKREEFLLLAHDPSPFKGELYMYVTREIEGRKIERLNGTFLSKVYEGSYSDVPRCLQKTEEFLAANEMVAKKHYVYFPYCPDCARKYGRNYVVVVSEIGD